MTNKNIIKLHIYGDGMNTIIVTLKFTKGLVILLPTLPHTHLGIRGTHIPLWNSKIIKHYILKSKLFFIIKQTSSQTTTSALKKNTNNLQFSNNLGTFVI